jgi:Fic family protein
LDDRLLSLLSAADLAVGRLDGIVRVVPDPKLFVAMYVRREAVLSSQIEGTQSTLEDLLEAELEPERAGSRGASSASAARTMSGAPPDTDGHVIVSGT